MKKYLKNPVQIEMTKASAGIDFRRQNNTNEQHPGIYFRHPNQNIKVFVDCTISHRDRAEPAVSPLWVTGRVHRTIRELERRKAKALCAANFYFLLFLRAYWIGGVGGATPSRSSFLFGFS